MLIIFCLGIINNFVKKCLFFVFLFLFIFFFLYYIYIKYYLYIKKYARARE